MNSKLKLASAFIIFLGCFISYEADAGLFSNLFNRNKCRGNSCTTVQPSRCQGSSCSTRFVPSSNCRGRSCGTGFQSSTSPSSCGSCSSGFQSMGSSSSCRSCGTGAPAQIQGQPTFFPPSQGAPIVSQGAPVGSQSSSRIRQAQPIRQGSTALQGQPLRQGASSIQGAPANSALAYGNGSSRQAAPALQNFNLNPVTYQGKTFSPLSIKVSDKNPNGKGRINERDWKTRNLHKNGEDLYFKHSDGEWYRYSVDKNGRVWAVKSKPGQKEDDQREERVELTETLADGKTPSPFRSALREWAWYNLPVNKEANNNLDMSENVAKALNRIYGYSFKVDKTGGTSETTPEAIPDALKGHEGQQAAPIRRKARRSEGDKKPEPGTTAKETDSKETASVQDLFADYQGEFVPEDISEDKLEDYLTGLSSELDKLHDSRGNESNISHPYPKNVDLEKLVEDGKLKQVCLVDTKEMEHAKCVYYDPETRIARIFYKGPEKPRPTDKLEPKPEPKKEKEEPKKKPLPPKRPQKQSISSSEASTVRDLLVRASQEAPHRDVVVVKVGKDRCANCNTIDNAFNSQIGNYDKTAIYSVNLSNNSSLVNSFLRDQNLTFPTYPGLFVIKKQPNGSWRLTHKSYGANTNFLKSHGK